LRRFNKHVVKNTYPLPIPQDQFDRLNGAKWFISLDAIQGFLQRMLDAKSRLKMAFTTPDGKFCMNRLPFGFINCPGEFQNMMDDILGVLRNLRRAAETFHLGPPASSTVWTDVQTEEVQVRIPRN
ncbi:unnamed protein product, partial [Allacma fusca]